MRFSFRIRRKAVFSRQGDFIQFDMIYVHIGSHFHIFSDVNVVVTLSCIMFVP